MAGWTYEDDENLVLAKQMGYQGAFVLFRDLFIKEIKGVVKSDDLFQQFVFFFFNLALMKDVGRSELTHSCIS